MIDYNMDRITRAKIVILRDQCAAYLVWWHITPNSDYLYNEAVKCLETAKDIYQEYINDRTETYESFNVKFDFNKTVQWTK